MEIAEYVQSRREMLEEALMRFREDLPNPAARLVLERMLQRGQGKRLRGVTSILIAESLGGTAEGALVAAEAVEICHQVSLSKDDWQDRDDTRRDQPALWRQVAEMAPALLGRTLSEGEARDLQGMATMMLTDIVIPHAVLMLNQPYGGGAVGPLVKAWGAIAEGQAKDLGFAPVNETKPLSIYQEIIADKTAPLFEVAAELGARAAMRDHQISLAQHYGRGLGLAFQVADDVVDLARHRLKPWSSLAKEGMMPQSLEAFRQEVALKDPAGTGITDEAIYQATRLLTTWLESVEATSSLFPDNEMLPLVRAFPRYCAKQMLAEASMALAKPRLGGVRS